MVQQPDSKRTLIVTTMASSSQPRSQSATFVEAIKQATQAHLALEETVDKQERIIEEQRTVIKHLNNALANWKKKREALREIIAEREEELEDLYRSLDALDLKLDMETELARNPTQQLSGLRVRILIDLARCEVLRILREEEGRAFDTWGQLRAGKDEASFAVNLAKRVPGLTAGMAARLCSQTLRNEGNDVAHNATDDEIWDAIAEVKDYEDRRALRALYRFTYEA